MNTSNNILIFNPIRNRYRTEFIKNINMVKGFQRNNYKVFMHVNKKELIDCYNENLVQVEYLVFENLKPQNIYEKIITMVKYNKILQIYTKNVDFCNFLIKCRFLGKIIFETNNINPNEKFLENLRKFKNLTLVINNHKLNKIYQIEKTLVLPNSIDYEYFSCENIFMKKILNNDKPNITYCGNLDKYKGIEFFLLLAKNMPHLNFNVVGGKKSLVDMYKSQYKDCDNIHFYNNRPYRNVPHFLYSSDVLVVPHLKKGNEEEPASIYCPTKLFEYLCINKPIICSRLEGIVDWVSENEVVYADQNNLRDFMKKINSVLRKENKEKYEKIIYNGHLLTKKMSVKNKCEIILNLSNYEKKTAFTDFL